MTSLNTNIMRIARINRHFALEIKQHSIKKDIKEEKKAVSSVAA